MDPNALLLTPFIYDYRPRPSPHPPVSTRSNTPIEDHPPCAGEQVETPTTEPTALVGSGKSGPTSIHPFDYRAPQIPTHSSRTSQLNPQRRFQLPSNYDPYPLDDVAGVGIRYTRASTIPNNGQRLQCDISARTRN